MEMLKYKRKLSALYSVEVEQGAVIAGVVLVWLAQPHNSPVLPRALSRLGTAPGCWAQPSFALSLTQTGLCGASGALLVFQ